MSVLAGQANVVGLSVLAVEDGTPITEGTVNFYLYALDGANAGKWYRGSDTSWQASESVAGAATHVGSGQWKLSLPSAVWTGGVRYRIYPKETGNLALVVGADLLCLAPAPTLGSGPVLHTYTVRDPSGNPVADALVMMSTDAGGAHMIHAGRSNAIGEVYFRPDVPTGTPLYLWSYLTGMDFVNPDTEHAL